MWSRCCKHSNVFGPQEQQVFQSEPCKSKQKVKSTHQQQTHIKQITNNIDCELSPFLSKSREAESCVGSLARAAAEQGRRHRVYSPHDCRPCSIWREKEGQFTVFKQYGYQNLQASINYYPLSLFVFHVSNSGFGETRLIKTDQVWLAICYLSLSQPINLHLNVSLDQSWSVLSHQTKTPKPEKHKKGENQWLMLAYRMVVIPVTCNNGLHDFKMSELYSMYYV